MNGDLNSWDKFCNYLWFDKKLNIWLDISKIKFTNEEIKNFEDKFMDVFSSIKELENGAISNICLLYTSPSPRDSCASRMPSSA